MFILDTNVISRTSPLALAPGSSFEGWLLGVGERSFLSVVTVSELQYGSARLFEKGATRKASLLQAWIEATLELYSDRLLPVDRAIARRTGEMLARAEKAGFKPGFEDACIAASAEIHGFTVLTYNVDDFQALGGPFSLPSIQGGP